MGIVLCEIRAVGTATGAHDCNRDGLEPTTLLECIRKQLTQNRIFNEKQSTQPKTQRSLHPSHSFHPRNQQ
jgi:hypothetical protein